MSIRAAWSRFWGSVKRRMGMSHPGWPTEPKDEAHALYRRRYEALVEGIRKLPRVKSNETTEKFFDLAQTVEQLHMDGDDPILPPGIRRRVEVIRENQTRLAAFGEVGQPGLLARLIPHLPTIAIICAVLMVTGIGGAIINGFRADFWEGRAKRNHEIAQNNYHAWEAEHQRAQERLQALGEAQRLTRQVAENLTAEREARARAAARERRRQREIQNVLVGAPEPPPWRLRDDGEAEDSPAEPSSP